MLFRSTTWFRVFVWNYDAAGAAIALHKGDKVIVTGRLQVANYVTKEGENRTALEINADSVGLIPKHAPEPQEQTVEKFDEEPVDNFQW